MASTVLEPQEQARLYKFTRILTLKVAQIVVQSRQGKKITREFDATKPENDMASTPSNLQWFNLSIPDDPDIDCDTKHILNGEVVEALSNVLCIEISLKTSDGDEMILEFWTVKMTPEHDSNLNSVSTIYYRMSSMLKSTLSISRITPAYKISRAQHKESYKVFHTIYSGLPNTVLLGDNYKTVKVSELHTPLGTILIEVLYRTKMTIFPDDKHKYLDYKTKTNKEDIMVKSDHFPMETPRNIYSDKKQIDLNKPLTAGAFVDVTKIQELHDTLRLQLPPEPPMGWLLAEKEKLDNKMKQLDSKPDSTEARINENAEAAQSKPHMQPTKAIEVPRIKDDKYSSLMEFPFADGSPITELANFYKECLHARSISEEWTDIGDVSASVDSETLSKQLKMFEDAVPEFDNMIASMFSTENSSGP